MFSRLKQLDVGGQVPSRLVAADRSEGQVASNKPVEGRFQARILYVAETLLILPDLPGYVFLSQRLPAGLIDKADLNRRGKTLLHDRSVIRLEITSHYFFLLEMHSVGYDAEILLR